LDEKYYPNDVQWAKEQEFLHLKQAKTTSVMECTAKFNKLSRFASTQVATEQARMNRFEYGLDHSIKGKFTAITFTSFQDMYQRALKVERVKKGADVKYKARIRGKRKMGLENYQGGRFNKKPFPFKNNGKGSQGKPYYHKCKRHHHGTCNFPARASFGCGEMGHMITQCPKIYPAAQGAQGGAGARPPMSATSTQTRGPRSNYGGWDKKPQNQARAFAMTAEEEDPNAVISGTLLLDNVYVHALFDPRATHSLVTPEVVFQLSCIPIEMDYELCVSTPIEVAVTSDVMLKDCPIIINKRKFSANLVRLEVKDFDVILGMDWLARHRVSIDCHKREVSIKR